MGESASTKESSYEDSEEMFDYLNYSMIITDAASPVR